MRKPCHNLLIILNKIDQAGDFINANPGKRVHNRLATFRCTDQRATFHVTFDTELQQVFLSLFRHACASLQRRSADSDFQPTIKIILSEGYDSFWIKIQHNGIDLSNDEQMGLFEPYFSDNQEADDFDAGQHLSFSYYIITEQHQGHMAVTSDPELGSTFHMQLPISP